MAIRDYEYQMDVHGADGIFRHKGEIVRQVQYWRGHWRDLDCLGCVSGEKCCEMANCHCRNCTIYTQAVKDQS